MKYSIVVRTYNESRYLPQLISAIASQNVPGEHVETIVVDSGSTDETINIAKSARCKILHLAKEEFSFGRSLNVGCAAASGDVLVFISGHCVPTGRDWLRLLSGPIALGEAALSFGRQEGGKDTKFSEHQLFRKYFPASRADAPNAFFCNNANAALLKHAWERYRFDEELPGLEDMDLGKRLVEAGMKVAYVPEASVFHYHHERWRQIKRRYEREAIALQKVMPSVQITFPDALRYFFVGVFGDCAKALSQRQFLEKVAEIVAFRFCQFWGSWSGNNIHRQLSRRMKERYFYPH